ncbi:hypothetical protein FRC11_013870, partial [Ceratobasidium sp. 423]
IHAYLPDTQGRAGTFYWDVLCASVPALPIFQDYDFENIIDLSPQTLSCGFTNPRARPAPHRWYPLTGSGPFKSFATDYFWVRNCLITFCDRLGEPAYVAHEVEQMIQKMRLDGSAESVGIILSSQQELVVVAVDGLRVRHSPILDIRPTNHGNGPGNASEGRLLLTQLLSSPLTVPPLPWHTPKPRQLPSIPKLPFEAIRTIVHNADLETYFSLCRVSRFIHSVCVANPRIGGYTVRKVLGFRSQVPMVFTAWSSYDSGLKAISLGWYATSWYAGKYQWEVEDVPSKELDNLIRRRNVG